VRSGRQSRHTSHVTRHTSYVIRHTSHVTRQPVCLSCNICRVFKTSPFFSTHRLVCTNAPPPLNSAPLPYINPFPVFIANLCCRVIPASLPSRSFSAHERHVGAVGWHSHHIEARCCSPLHSVTIPRISKPTPLVMKQGKHWRRGCPPASWL
jgi:hypothetical protein